MLYYQNFLYRSRLSGSIVSYVNKIKPTRFGTKIDAWKSFLRGRSLGSLNVTIKGLEAFLEAAFQLQLQCHVFYSGYTLGEYQIHMYFQITKKNTNILKENSKFI
jgi:hypothetical protein